MCRSARSCSSSRRPRGRRPGPRQVPDGLRDRRRRRPEEGDRVVVISHSVISDDPNFDDAVVRNVEVTVHDNDLPAIQVIEVDPLTGEPGQHDGRRRGHARSPQLTDAFDVKLSIDADRAGHRRAQPSNDRVVLSGGRASRRSRRALPASPASTRIAAQRDRPASASRSRPSTTSSARIRTPRRSRSPSTRRRARTSYDDALPARVDALVIDDDTAGVVVIESDGTTLVIAGTTAGGPGPGDSYRIRLTLQPTGAGHDRADHRRPDRRHRRRPDRLPGDRRPVRRCSSSSATSPIAGQRRHARRRRRRSATSRRGLRARPADPDRERRRRERRLHDRRRSRPTASRFTLDDRACRRHLHAAR